MAKPSDQTYAQVSKVNREKGEEKVVLLKIKRML
jgi:hypothetical protein